MDETLLLLMHTQRGLKLEREDLAGILAGDPQRPVDNLLSADAHQYLRVTPKWRDESFAVLEESAKHGIRWSRVGDDDYPHSWRHLSHNPVVFNYLGDQAWKKSDMLAVVGSRTPMTETRMWMQRELSLFLRKQNVGVVSGGARGIDQWAHRLSMDENRPTICILPSGILNPYPFGQEEFLRRIVAGGGCLLSTLPLREPMRKHNFRVRNRWIVGLSPAVFVVEANRRSGTAMTAELAQEEGREICTLPVFPHSSQGMANLDLLIGGAHLLRDHQDLQVLWNRKLSPTFLERANSERKEESVDQP